MIVGFCSTGGVVQVIQADIVTVTNWGARGWDIQGPPGGGARPHGDPSLSWIQTREDTYWRFCVIFFFLPCTCTSQCLRQRWQRKRHQHRHLVRTFVPLLQAIGVADAAVSAVVRLCRRCRGRQRDLQGRFQISPHQERVIPVGRSVGRSGNRFERSVQASEKKQQPPGTDGTRRDVSRSFPFPQAHSCGSSDWL